MRQAAIYADTEALARAAAAYLTDQIITCIGQKGRCHIALPGGTTPGRCLELVSSQPLPWHNIHVYLGDERCFPVAHEERNDTMIVQKLWSRIDAPADNFHPIPAELGPELAAQRYTGLINELGYLDIVLLGMGEDGHTASLFPGNAAVTDERAAVPVYDAPKPPKERVSLGMVSLQKAGQRIVLVTGANKHDALTRVEQGDTLPISLIGEAHWFIDQAAALGQTEDSN
ncbi:MAG: 6-phosphogluconolactonase [Gammaproteobacteria bacterium]|nr:6-phosphogluconolactonase [Gammaproteobacteria bacterium]NNJ96556.1 6-phosphogluconolactonase [Gammaproteobacteria bacterium]